MKLSNVLVWTVALSVLLAAIIACKDDNNGFGISRKRINLTRNRRCKKSHKGKTQSIKSDVKTVRFLGKKLKNALKVLVADFQAKKHNTNSGHGQE
jgi:hypothetical protein